MSSESTSTTAIARAIGVQVSTVTRWRARAAAHPRCFSEEKPVVSEPIEAQLGEPRVGGRGAAEGTWAWSAIEVKNRQANGGIARSTSRLRNTPGFRNEFARERLEDSRRPNTACIEPLNLFERTCCCCLRRCRQARARKPQCVESVLELLRGEYNFIRPHLVLRVGREYPLGARS